MPEPLPLTTDRSTDGTSLSATTGYHPPGSSDNRGAHPDAPFGARYFLLEELARGGMGVVFRASDTSLGREVAVKVLHERFQPDSAPARRFADEARITAQLQHPVIPPVHDHGILPDGRPFLAMKLIRGATLATLLERRPDPSYDRGRFVAVFEQVCQGLAYAHAQSVIHRDLKPANIMVGTFGEVQIMDWGLAKVINQGPTSETANPVEPEGDTEVSSRSESNGAFTLAGSVLGTLAFMPPEQAAGAVSAVDTHSDVFGLGAILAVILTGRPPFAAASAEAIRVKAAQGDIDECFARLDACAADPELIGLCKRCLAVEPSKRPTHAGHVAEGVASLRQAAEERARRAEQERVRGESKAVEQRKRRRVQLALLVAVVLLLLGGGAFGWWQRETGREATIRLSRNALAVSGLLDQTEEALRAGEAAKATIPLEVAQKRASEGGADALVGRLEQRQADLAVLLELDAIDLFRWTPIGNKTPSGLIMASRYRKALGRFGLDPETNSSAEAAVWVSGSAVRAQVVTALDRWLREERLVWVREVLQGADPDPFRDTVRDGVLVGDGAKLTALAGRPNAADQPPGFVTVMGENMLIPAERRRELLKVAVRHRSRDLGLLMALGFSYASNPVEGAADQIRWYQVAVAIAPRNTAARYNLGLALFNRGDRDGAEAEYRQLLQFDPKSCNAHDNLGWVLQQKGDLDGAIAEYRKAIDLDPTHLNVRNNLGLARMAKGDLNGAMAEFEEAIRLDPKFAWGHFNRGLALKEKGDLAGAVAEFEKSLRLDPKLSQAHDSLGLILSGKGDLAGAMAAHQEAIRINPKFTMARFNLGNVLQARGDLDRAVAEFEQVIRLDPRYTYAHNSLGNALYAKGNLDGAVAAYKEALRLDPKFTWGHFNLGNALYARGNLDGAVAEYKEALRLDPKFPPAHFRLPQTERMRELLPRLPDILAGRAKPNTPAESCEFAALCYQPFQKHYAAGTALYEKAFETDPRLADDLVAGHRYAAASIAVLAGAGVDLEPAKRTVLRGKALAWLQADLALLRKLITSVSPGQREAVAGRLASWFADQTFIGTRPGGERTGWSKEEVQWDKFWSEVRTTLAEAQSPSPTRPGAKP